MLISKIITIGDEILIGQVVNTNASFISEKLYSIGIPVSKVVTIEDTENALLNELDDSINNYNVTIITGGLGPTHDDITKPTLVKYFKDELISDDKVLEKVKSIFKSRNIDMPPVNYEQAMVPKNSKVIFNEYGTAPGLWIEKNNKIVIALPGVPFEMKEMMKLKVITMLKEKFDKDLKYVLKSKTLLTTGIGESHLAELIGDVKPIIENNKLAFLPSLFGVRLRIDVRGENLNDVDKKIELIETRLRNKIDDYIFGSDDDLLEKIVGDLLIQKNLTLAVAESCTGGLIASKITDISGSSKYFKGGILSYSNYSKLYILGIRKDILEKYGAVSEETAREMAVNVREKLDADIGISTTGIAGPAGGSEKKPVGLVWIGYSDNKRTFAIKFLFGNNREKTKIRSAYQALVILKKEISNLL
jgi:nicotinamide-nucleotide amidase